MNIDSSGGDGVDTEDWSHLFNLLRDDRMFDDDGTVGCAISEKAVATAPPILDAKDKGNTMVYADDNRMVQKQNNDEIEIVEKAVNIVPGVEVGAQSAPVNVQDWSSKHSGRPSAEYLTCAVDLAWMLATNLGRHITSSEEIALQDQDANTRGNSAATSVGVSDIKMGFFSNSDNDAAWDAMQMEDELDEPSVDPAFGFFSKMKDFTTPLLEQWESVQEGRRFNASIDVFIHDTPSTRSIKQVEVRNVNKRMNEREACYTLGRILLQVFSKGQSDSLMLSKYSTATLQDEEIDPGLQFNDLLTLLGEEPGVALSQERKKRASCSLSGGNKHVSSESLASKALLHGLGTPSSVCALVSDLLESNSKSDISSDYAIKSLEEALYDLTQMKENPRSFLFDRTCPEQALKHLSLFQASSNTLFGRQKEIAILADMAETVSICAGASIDPSTGIVQEDSGLVCEAAYLSGHAGSGKSSLIRHVTKSCEANDWFVVNCKFEDKSNSMATVSALCDV